MRSLRGPRGGVTLSVPAESTTLYDIICAIEGADHFDNCVLGLPSCDSANPCPLHAYWSTVRDGIKNQFQSVSLKTLSDRVSVDGLRISSGTRLVEAPKT